jgi:polar amino acid transport system substrate-binding protein
MMKNFQLRSLCLVVFLVAQAAIAKSEIRVGVAAEPYPPFTSKNTAGAWEGWEVDVVNALCETLTEKCEFVEVAWDGIIPALRAKKFDVIAASMVINGKRKEVISFSDMYYGGAFAMIGAKNGDMDIAPAHFTGKIIGVQTASVNAAYVEKHYVSAGVEVKTYATQDEANADLAAGRVDYVLANAIALDAFLQSDDGKACCEAKANVETDLALGGEVGFGLRKEDTALQAKLNSAIKALAGSGKLGEIATKWKLTGRITLPAK